MAAVSAARVNEMGKKIDGGQVTVAKMLHSVTAAEKAEWLLNNLRYRQFLSAPVRGLLPSRTTSNEALRAEINTWFRQIQGMRKSTSRLKLTAQCLGKLLAHQTALHSPTCSQLPQMPLGSNFWAA